MAFFASSDVRAAVGDADDGEFFDPDATYDAAVARNANAGPGATPTVPRAGGAAKQRFAPKASTGTAAFRGGAADGDSDDDVGDELETSEPGAGASEAWRRWTRRRCSCATRCSGRLSGRGS